MHMKEADRATDKDAAATETKTTQRRKTKSTNRLPVRFLFINFAKLRQPVAPPPDKEQGAVNLKFHVKQFKTNYQ